jgi:hypothetical protein
VSDPVFRRLAGLFPDLLLKAVSFQSSARFALRAINTPKSCQFSDWLYNQG